MKDVLAAVLVVACIGLASFGAGELSYRIYARYAPLGEQVRRETFEQSRAFHEGMVRDLENLRLEWARGDAAQKAAVASIARHRLADVPDDILTPSLRAWRRELEAP